MSLQRSSKPTTGASARKAATLVERSKSGQTESHESVEVWTDEAYALATGIIQILDENGKADPARVPALSAAEHKRLYAGMLQSRLLDDRLMPLQRQGRIGFYIEARGQEAGMIGGAHAIEPRDYFISGLRETAAGIYRGMPLRTHLAQMFGNINDVTLGHQLPCHSGTRASNHLVMSSCVSSQLPQAAGVAWAAKLSKSDQVALGYMGDGGTSAEDFHVAMNFAAVFKLPVVFVCQNNQWAISTPLSQQTVSETIAIKGLAYGIPSYRVDGNDVFAVYSTVKAAVDRARAGGGPSFIENLTYRIGPHSSSDDPTRYRDPKEPEPWRTKCPLRRYKLWLEREGILPAEQEAALAAALEQEIRDGISAEESAPKPERSSVIAAVYAEPNWILKEQLADLERVRARRGGGGNASGSHG
ncbi:MAG: thiamine pyrophosphate-dependent enzyme [Deltaproteobacteria bacterium]|nr:thiamine pyrophosphate-dependent enzyme [Deltaproteobacteria bacterium]